MRLSYRSIVGLAVPIALLSAGCSSGGARLAEAPTTFGQQTGADTATIRKLSPCATRDENPNLAELNAGVVGAGEVLVPFAASTVRLCQWNSSGRSNGAGGGISTLESVRDFVAETNRMPYSESTSQPRAHPRDKQIASQPTYLTYENDTQQITLRLDAYGDVTNGFLSAHPTCIWRATFTAVSCDAP